MPEARGHIEFEELGLGSLLRRYQLRVPPNQREYSWTEREIVQLLQDFAEAEKEDGPYFLGTIVTIPRESGILEVVDGQQRLATTAILLSAIRDYLQGQGDDVLVRAIESELLSTVDRARRESVPHLTLNLDDNELFRRIILPGPGEPEPQPRGISHQLLMLARDEARKQVNHVVATLEPRAHADALNRWINFIEFRALVVLVRVANDADAFRMFETLNDRGLRTSQADLVKNVLFGRAGKRIAEVQNCWSHMRGALESASDDSDITINFLRHALIAQRGYLREADVYDAVRDIARSETRAASFASTLESLAAVYVATFNPESERWNTYPEPARRAIEVFNLFDIKPMRALLLAIAAKMNPRETAAAFRFLIALGVRLIIASSTRTSSVEVPLASAAKKVFDGEIATAVQLVANLTPVTPGDPEFRMAFETARVSNAKLTHYYLRSLEMAAKEEADPWFVPQGDRQVINLEHILPRRPEGNWPEFNEDEVRLWATRLGNVALLRASDNSTLRSQSFADKKLVYASSPYVLTKLIAEADKWSTDAIAGRQKKLAHLSLKAWPIKART